MIVLMVGGLAVLGGVALVLTVVDRVLESRWRFIAAARRDEWLLRQDRVLHGEPWTDTWQDD
ncbi:MAG: hypothetical protein ACT4RN_00905 [Pseudonocardia sp.]